MQIPEKSIIIVKLKLNTQFNCYVGKTIFSKSSQNQWSGKSPHKEK